MKSSDISISLNGGRDRGRLVTEADDLDGQRVVTRIRVDTQREIDRLYMAGQLVQQPSHSPAKRGQSDTIWRADASPAPLLRYLDTAFMMRSRNADVTALSVG